MPFVVQRMAAALALVVLAPVIAALAVAVRVTSSGPSFYRAERVSHNGNFTLYKLRSMRVGNAADGPRVTATGDSRVTGLGRVLRRTKLDELPQLWNVVRGEMSLVGPRPEDPRYVDRSDPVHREVFSARPGITGPTALAYRDEEAILAAAALEVARGEGRERATIADVERAYREAILPVKVAMDAEYLRSRSTRGDLAILGRTIGQVLRRTARQ